MVVAASLRSSGGGGRRRLLQADPPTHEDDYDLQGEVSEQLDALLTAEGWASAARHPCGALALAYQKERRVVGVLERVELERCAFWRLVGRRVLAARNLTGVVNETFLVSMEDLLLSALATPAALVGLAGAGPGLWASVALYHPWMGPVRGLVLQLVNQLELLDWMRDIDADVHEALFGDDEEHESRKEASMERLALKKEYSPNTTKRLWLKNASRISTRTRRTNRTARDSTTRTKRTARAGRRLLFASSVVESVVRVQAYSGQVISQTRQQAGEVPSRVAGAWSTASFVWPPVYSYTLRTCPVGLAMLDMGRQAVMVNALYFKGFRDAQPRAIDRSLRGNLPDFSGMIDAVTWKPSNTTTQTTTWASWVFHRLLDAASVRPEHLVAFFTTDRKWSLQWILETSVKCDLAAVVTCSRHERDLVMSTVVFLLGYASSRALMGAMGMGWVATLYLLSYPGFILWYAFGVPPSCFPMVPTCLLADVIATMEMLVPERLEFPPELVCANQTCLRSCGELNFTGWVDPLAFAVCDTDPRTCGFLRETMAAAGEGWDFLGWTAMVDALGRFEKVVLSGRALAAHRLCTWVSFVTATPALAVAGGATVLASAALMAVLDLVPSLVAFAGQAYIFFSAPG
jgi:hypothetical protein